MERIEIRPPRWKTVLGIMGLIGFVVAGAWMLIDGNGWIERAVGAFSVAFFGGMGVYALGLRIRGRFSSLAITPAGLEVGLPGIAARLLPWDDVEEIGTTRFFGSEFTTIRLRSYQSFLRGITPGEARAALQFFGALRSLGYASIPVVATQARHVATQVAGFMKGSGEVRSLAQLLAYQRERFGAEILLGWNLRDRPAAAFAEFLEARRREASPLHETT
jgi:hypothetical protein